MNTEGWQRDRGRAWARCAGLSPGIRGIPWCWMLLSCFLVLQSFLSGVCLSLEPQAVRHPIPPASELEQAFALLRQAYGLHADLSRVDPRTALQLSDRMYAASFQDGMRHAEQILLLQSSMQYAALLGDVERVLRGVRAQGRHFQIDWFEVAYYELEQMASKVRSDRQRRALADGYRELAEEALRRGAFGIALDSARRAMLHAGAHGGQEKERLRNFLSFVRRVEQESTRFTRAQAKLGTNPDDMEANRIAGEFLFHFLADWGRAEPHLARIGVASLDRIVGLERKVRVGAEVAEVLSLADAWWEHSSRHRGEVAFFMKARSIAWYQTVHARTEGGDRRQLEARMLLYNQLRSGFDHVGFLVKPILEGVKEPGGVVEHSGEGLPASGAPSGERGGDGEGG